MIRAGILIIVIGLVGNIHGQEAHNDWAQRQNVPPEIRVAFERAKTESAYVLSFHVNPFYLRGDFNGDNSADLAVLIKNKTTGTIGIAIVDGQSKKVQILGAGTTVGNGGDDFRWLDAWHVYSKGAAHQGKTTAAPLRLKGDALYVEKLESASALIYWTGKKYEWYQQGD